MKNIYRNSERIAILTVVSIALLAHASPAAAENSLALSKKELKTLLATARTPADQKRLAAYYHDKAKRLTAKARDFSAQADILAKQPATVESKQAFPATVRATTATSRSYTLKRPRIRRPWRHNRSNSPRTTRVKRHRSKPIGGRRQPSRSAFCPVRWVAMGSLISFEGEAFCLRRVVETGTDPRFGQKELWLLGIFIDFLSERLHIREKVRLRFESTFTNVFNHTNFAPPATQIDNSSFVVLSAGQTAENPGNRTGQLALRVEF